VKIRDLIINNNSISSSTTKLTTIQQPPTIANIYRGNLSSTDDWEIRSDSIELYKESVLGRGAYATVIRGKYYIVVDVYRLFQVDYMAKHQ
jgi:hypothetical protein